MEINKNTGDQELWIYDVKSGLKKRILRNSELAFFDKDDSLSLSLMDYQWNPHEDGILVTDLGDLFYLDLEVDSLRRLTKSNEPEKDATFSPDGRWVSFIRKNDLFIYDLQNDNEKKLTSDGSEDILNGRLSWVYEEEFGTRGDDLGYSWSPNAHFIVFYQMDESNVPQYPLINYQPVHPEIVFKRYPKAGDNNPIVKLGVINVLTSKLLWINTGEDADNYIPRFYWVPGSHEIAFMQLDRKQKHLKFIFANIQSGDTRVVISERHPKWINIGDFVHFLKKQPAFIWGSEQSGYRHLYLYDLNGKLIRPLTIGGWAVTSLEGVNEAQRLVYFIGTKDDITERHFYSASLLGGEPKRLSNREGVHRVKMASNSRYYLDTFSSPLTPQQISLFSGDGKFLTYIDENKQPELDQYHLQEMDFIEVKGENGLTYHAFMIKPPGFNPEKKYPVLIYVYGGPHSQRVIKEFTGLWHQLMVQKGYIVFCLDNRGTDNRGLAWSTAVYRQLGKLELEDQLEGVKYLKKLPFVDPDRIGIWGWSYGGFMVLYALTHSDAFKTGVSVAPVTDWRFYDTIYTERYMDMPGENNDGYFNSAPLNFAEQLSGKLFLAHGMRDGNVNFQNTEDMVDKLVKAGKKFQLQIYPNQSHSILSTADRIHLFESITDFLLLNL